MCECKRNIGVPKWIHSSQHIVPPKQTKKVWLPTFLSFDTLCWPISRLITGAVENYTISFNVTESCYSSAPNNVPLFSYLCQRNIVTPLWQGKFQLDIVVLAAAHCKGSGTHPLERGWTLFHSGVAHGDRHRASVGILIAPRLCTCTLLTPGSLLSMRG